VWRIAQPTQLLMNTVAPQVTVFTVRQRGLRGPDRAGSEPDEWARLLPFVSDQPIDSRLAMEASNLGRIPTARAPSTACYLEWVAAG